ncbi:MAG TPA: cardiolipin synthase [Cellvibrionaceae bacterium]
MSGIQLLIFIQQVLIWGHLLLVVGFAVRVIMRRLPVGASLAWLLVLALLPYVGVGLYLLFGERFLGLTHKQRSTRLRQAYGLNPRVSLPHHFNWQGCHPASASLSNLEFYTSGIPAVGGNRLQFFKNAEETIGHLCDDIRMAEHHCHLEFYIWQPGGLPDGVVEALLEVAERGVRCRIMLDAVGSASFFSSNLARTLRDGNIELIKACPIGIMPWHLARYDLRNHRKTVVIDDRVAYMGSFNLIDPMQFKRGAGVGAWVDLMARIEGPVVTLFDAVFRGYWNIETGQDLPLLDADIERRYDQAVVQVAPSGPDAASESILFALLQAIYAAAVSVDIVTPYFVPGEALELALKIAARRGVKVRIIVPEKVDSFLVRHASRSYFADLLAAGVEIYQYEQNLLHSKCVVIDESLAFFGTVNLDLRSLWLNFEMTLIVYDPANAKILAGILADYRQQGHLLNLQQWQQRPQLSRFFENITHLFSPLI